MLAMLCGYLATDALSPSSPSSVPEFFFVRDLAGNACELPVNKTLVNPGAKSNQTKPEIAKINQDFCRTSQGFLVSDDTDD